MSEVDAFPLAGDWSFPTAIHAGAGRIAELPDVCAGHGIAKPLLVTDRGTARLPFTETILQRGREGGLEMQLFSEVQPNPSIDNVEAGISAFLEGEHDGVIALGGGSALDAGKAIAFMALQAPGVPAIAESGGDDRRITAIRASPSIAVPTTAGTGSEVGRSCVLSMPSVTAKKIVSHPAMLPVAVVLDAELTLGLPPDLTAATGLDAFTHCFEAYCAPGFHPLADAIALEGMRIIKDWLPVAYRNGNDVEARSFMLAAASMGAVAFQKGLGAVHALSHSVGAVYDTHHGLTNAVYLPYVVQRNRPAIETKAERIAAVVGLEEHSFEALLQWIVTLRSELGIPNGALDLGVRSEDIPRLSQMALVDPALSGNPAKLDVGDFASLLRRANDEDLG